MSDHTLPSHNTTNTKLNAEGHAHAGSRKHARCLPFLNMIIKAVLWIASTLEDVAEEAITWLFPTVVLACIVLVLMAVSGLGAGRLPTALVDGIKYLGLVNIPILAALAVLYLIALRKFCAFYADDIPLPNIYRYFLDYTEPAASLGLLVARWWRPEAEGEAARAHAE